MHQPSSWHEQISTNQVLTGINRKCQLVYKKALRDRRERSKMVMTQKKILPKMGLVHDTKENVEYLLLSNIKENFNSIK